MLKSTDLTKKNYNITILILSIIGLIFSIYLIIIDYLITDYCPKIFFLPACYLVFVSFALIFISELLSKYFKNYIFFIGSIMGLILAVWLSFNEIIKNGICPRLFEIPLCYLSLGIFLLIILSKKWTSIH